LLEMSIVCVVQSLELGTRLQTFGYMHEFWSRSEVHGKLIATCRHDFTNKCITATRALVGGVFRLLEMSTACVVQSLELGTRLQTFRYIHQVWSRSEVHGKLIATCRDDFTNKYITATRALVGGVFRLLEMSIACVVQSLELGTRLQAFRYMHEFWSGSEVHGKLIATCRDDFTNKYITATRALVGRVFRLLELSTRCVVQSLELGTRLQTFGYMHEFWSRSWKINCYMST